MRSTDVVTLFRINSPTDGFPTLYGEGFYLRAPQARDFEAWSALRAESRAFLEPWEPLWPSDDLTRSAYRRRIKRYAEEIEADTAYPMFLFTRSFDTLIGGLTLGLVRRGVAQSCTIGYWMGVRFAGKGYMTKAVRTAVHFAFNDLGLHRIEAACLPNNEPSIKLLEKVGFSREGYARNYLCIAGVWRDHLLFARLKDDPTTGA